MTIEEAKEQLRELIFDTESLIVGDVAKGIYRKDLEALKMAISAIDRQIPKKPIRLPADHPFYYEAGGCPTCGVSVYISDDKYCLQCGQALDWSDVDD